MAVVLTIAGEAGAQSPPAAADDTPGLFSGLFAEPRAITRAIDQYNKRTGSTAAPKDGFYLETENLITGSGWLSAGPGYRRSLAQGKGRLWASTALSIRLYNMAQARVEFPDVVAGRVGLGAQLLYRDSLQVNYFGLGNDSLKEDRSGYRLRSTELVGLATARAGGLTLAGRLGWLPDVTISKMGGRLPDYPDAHLLFDETTAPGLGQDLSFAFADAEVSSDTRDQPDFPRRGGLYEVRWAGYADRSGGRYSLHRFDLKASHYVPIAARNWVLALNAWGVASHVGADQTVPFFLLPSLGGKNTVRGYLDYRFHDRAMELFSVESRWAIFEHVDAALFGDAGKVASRIGDLGLNDMKTSYGIGLRVHNLRKTIARLDLARGTEGWNIIFKMSEPFKRSTPSGRWSAIIPFVP